MPKLSLDPKFVDKCTQATRSAIKRKLMGLEVAYHTPDKPVLLLAEADSNTRAIWAGLSDSAIATYDAARWVSFAHRTTLASVQYDQATNLPLPIHLGHLLKEYLF